MSYDSAAAVQQALQFRSARLAVQVGVSAGELQRRFLFDRFLVRVFATDPDAWYLKGGTALLARLPTARATKDVDLVTDLEDLDEAEQRLYELGQVRLNDHLLFLRAGPALDIEPGESGPARGRTIKLRPQWGTKQMNPFAVDIITAESVGHSVATSSVPVDPCSRVHLGELDHQEVLYRLYGLNAHVADKVAATMATYHGRTSSRTKDLVDLVTIAQDPDFSFDSIELHQALHQELARRDLQPTALEVPQQWAKPYRRLASPATTASFEDACHLVAQFINPVIQSGEPRQRWNPTTHTWTHGTTAST